MTLEYYKYESQSVKCPKCNWQGIGKDLVSGEVFNELFELDCPKCAEVVAIVSFPTFDEVLEKGSEKEKKEVRELMAKRDSIGSSQVNSIDELPEIKGSIIIEAIEKHLNNKDVWLEIYANNQLLWKEMVIYEFYQRFIDICQMLDEKYSGQIEAIKYYENSIYLLGDHLPAPQKIRDCLDELKWVVKQLKF